jgi:diguanylate cyclase (GGDEF)-like protein
MRAWTLIKENVGLKIGVATGIAIFLIVLLLVGIVASIPVALISKFSLIKVLLVLAVLIASFSALVITISTNLLIQRPLTRLMTAIRRAESGDLRVRARVDSEDEIGQVASQFNQMLTKVNSLEGLKLEAERKLTTAHEELKYKAVLEEKAKIISSTNRKLEESLKELSILYNVSQAMTASIDPEELCNLLGEVITKNVGVQDFAILLLNPEIKQLEVKAALGFRRNDQVRSLCFELGEGITGKAVQGKKPLYIPDTSKDSSYLHYKGVQEKEGSFLCLPIVAKDRVLGTVNFSRAGVDAFSESEIKVLTTIVGQVAIAMDNARLYAETKEMSLTDELTKVYNRRHFHKMLEMEFKRARRFARPLSLLMIDVDHFKKLNDSFGHIEGDHLLVNLAKVLSENLREVDTVARYGGEEFAVILPNTSEPDAHQVGTKLKDLVQNIALSPELRKKMKVTVSVGVSALHPESDSIEDLINHADIALYRAKSRGRNRVVVYQEGEAASLRVVE